MSPLERLVKKPVAEWGGRERWTVRVLAVAVGFLSLEGLAFGVFLLRGLYGAPGGGFQFFVLFFTTVLFLAVEKKIRSLK